MDHGYLLTRLTLTKFLQALRILLTPWDWNESTSWDCVIYAYMPFNAGWKRVKKAKSAASVFLSLFETGWEYPRVKRPKRKRDGWLAGLLVFSTLAAVSRLLLVGKGNQAKKPTAWIWSKCLLFAGICLWSLQLCSGQRLLQIVWWSVTVLPGLECNIW